MWSFRGLSLVPGWRGLWLCLHHSRLTVCPHPFSDGFEGTMIQREQAWMLSQTDPESNPSPGTVAPSSPPAHLADGSQPRGRVAPAKPTRMEWEENQRGHYWNWKSPGCRLSRSSGQGASYYRSPPTRAWGGQVLCQIFSHLLPPGSLWDCCSVPRGSVGPHD